MKTALLQSSDLTGITFWLISMALLATTVFFFIERNSVKASWRTSITLSGLVTGIAFVHYMYMREVWVTTGTSPTVFRYIDWLLTVPILMVEFYFILSAVKKVSSGIFWRLLIGTLVMLLGGYAGEAGYISVNAGFIIGMGGWIFILYEVFSGEAGKEAMAPFSVDLFKGMLAFFLLDMGLMTARNAHQLKGMSKGLVLYAMGAPLVHASIALVLALLTQASQGDATLLMVLAASASYIAVPAVVRYAIPEANPSLYVGLSLGLTFPFNILLGIPLYAEAAAWCVAG